MGFNSGFKGLIVSCIDYNSSSLCLYLMLRGRVAVYQTWHCNEGN